MHNNTKVDLNIANSQKEQLEYYLTQYESGQDKFLVLNHEAGFGKSITTDSAIINNPARKYLLVKKYNSEKDESLERMKDSINWIYGEMCWDTVVVINSDNSYRYENEPPYIDELVNSNVLIISHEKYRLLSNSGKRDLYMQGRHTLIIDEYVEVPIVTINDAYLNQNGVLFPRNLGKKEYSALEEYIGNLLDSLHNLKDLNEGNLKLVEIPKVQKKRMLELIGELETSFRSNRKRIINHNEKIKINDQPITLMTYSKFFSEISSIVNNQCIYSSYSRSLSTFRSFDFWGLRNNIILDASGGILTEYEISSKFEIRPQDKVYDYTDTTIHIKKFKSYKSHIESRLTGKHEGKKAYFETIKNYILDNHGQNDETLIVNYKNHNKDYFDDISLDRGIYTAWHGNILGKNTWRECNKLYINSTFNLPEESYVLMYSFFSGKRITKSHLKLKKTDKGREFKTKKIEALKQNFILHNFYQTIKRINRNVDKPSDIFIVTDNAHFLKEIPKLMKNVNVRFDYEISLPKSITEYGVWQRTEKYVSIENELKRMASADPKDTQQFSKSLFCSNTGISPAKLKAELYKKTYKQLSEAHGVSFRKTFAPNCKLFHFTKSKTGRKA